MTFGIGGRQWTLRGSVRVSGIGLHSGRPCEVECLPAPPESGIVFEASDSTGPPIAARAPSVTAVDRAVTLGGGVQVRTVEHLLSAAWALGVSNLRIRVRGGEVPILDGSALPYVQAFRKAGTEEQDASWPSLHLATPVWIEEDGASLLAVPAERCRVTYVVPLTLGAQVIEFDPERDDYETAIAPARTWGYAADLEQLHARGLAHGASLDNALGLDEQGYVNAPRFPDEPARHKVLDLLGDLALLGRPLMAHVIAVGAGHPLHIQLVRRLEEVGELKS